jgi:hypothetical protein
MWSKQIPKKEGLYWIREPIIGSLIVKYWPPRLVEIQLSGPDMIVRQINSGGGTRILPHENFLISEEVVAPEA